MSAGTNFLDSQRRGFPVQRGCAATARPRFPVPNPTQGTGDPVAGRGGCAEADGRSPAGGDRPAEGPEGSTIDQAQRHGAGHLANGVKANRRQAASWQGPAPCHHRGPGSAGHRAGGVSFQGLRALPRAGACAVGAGGPLSTRALDHARWADLHRTLAGRHLRTFRPGSASFRADAVPSGAVDPRVTALLQSLGVAISERQVQRLLTEQHETFLTEAHDVLRAGLETAAWISVDDTGARHQAANGFCTQIGNDRFTWFGTRVCKSRSNFLDVLRAGHADYVLNQAAFDYLRRRGLPGPLIARLAEAGATQFADHAAWIAFLDRIGIVSPAKAHTATIQDPVQIATEGARWGSINAHGFLRDAVILSDDAGQFAIGHHALCWVHAERLVHKLEPVTEAQHAAQARMRTLIWNFYADLKAYRAAPSPRRRLGLRARFERIFRRRTGFVILDRLLARLHANKAELLMVLERPETPLNTNGSENDIRCQVTRRKISAGTRSDAGRDARDAFLGLVKTCAKHGIAFWNYLGSRLNVPGQPTIPFLPDLIRARPHPA